MIFDLRLKSLHSCLLRNNLFHEFRTSFRFTKTSRAPTNAADKYKCMYLVNKKDITQCWFGRIEFVSVYLGRNHSFCNNHNSWAKVNGQGDMQTCSRQNVVSSKSITTVYHSFKLDYIAFFLDDVREFCENLKGPWCILQSKSFNLHWWLYRLEYSRVCLV